MGWRIWSRLGSLYLGVESDLWRLHRGKIPVSRATILPSLLIQKIFGVAYIVGLVALPSTARRGNMTGPEHPTAEYNEK
jgi:hypothetical protein